jgi:hypothetical protein
MFECFHLCDVILISESILARVKMNDMKPLMSRILPILALATASILLVACSATPQSRIQANPSVFNELPPQYKNAVQQGRLEEGMPPSAVFLAWGHPTSVSEGKINGKNTVRWLYSSLQPVATPSPFLWGGGYWGPYPYYYNRFGYMNNVTYVPVNTGFVQFVNGKATSWEKRLD